MDTFARLLVFSAALLAAGCNGPSRKSHEILQQLECGFSETQVADVSDALLRKQSGIGPDGATHLIADDSMFGAGSQIRLTMPQGKLQAAELCWEYRTKAMACAQWPKLECGGDGT
jgi:hypothetical protein